MVESEFVIDLCAVVCAFCLFSVNIGNDNYIVHVHDVHVGDNSSVYQGAVHPGARDNQPGIVQNGRCFGFMPCFVSSLFFSSYFDWQY